MENKLLKVKDVAAMLQSSEGHVRRLIVRDQIPKPLRPGGRVIRWTREAINEWIIAGCPECSEVLSQ